VFCPSPRLRVLAWSSIEKRCNGLRFDSCAVCDVGLQRTRIQAGKTMNQEQFIGLLQDELRRRGFSFERWTLAYFVENFWPLMDEDPDPAHWAREIVNSTCAETLYDTFRKSDKKPQPDEIKA